MATQTDYVSKSFGSFTIVQHLASGAEAEVFVCKHESTGLLYILRLDAADDSIWDNAPLIPPHNLSLEGRNARGTWLVAPRYYSESLAARKKSKDSWVFSVPAIYGVLLNQYLVPVAPPIRVRSAWDVDRLLEATPLDRVKQFLTACFQDQNLSANLLLRLCFCVVSHTMDLKEAQATLRCQHFRANVSIQDVRDAAAVYAALKGQTKESRDLAVLLDFTRAAMTLLPFDPLEDSEQFEIRREQRPVEQFSLFLQEYAAVRQQVITLEG